MSALIATGLFEWVREEEREEEEREEEEREEEEREEEREKIEIF